MNAEASTKSTPPSPRSALKGQLGTYLGLTVVLVGMIDPLLPSELMSPKPRTALLAATRRYQDKALVLWRKWLALP